MAGRKNSATAKVPPRRLVVRADEKRWTKAEVTEVRGGLNGDRNRLRAELSLADREVQDLMGDADDRPISDPSGAASTTLGSHLAMSLANNAREMLTQTERALLRLDEGSYGVCESCSHPIGKMRMMAFPRATLCISCLQREERVGDLSG